jgi:predicted GIY-YIG superfamily endonuclease
MPRRTNVPGTIYLLHFDRKLSHAGHYIGWSEELDGRLAAHKSGLGARLTEVLRERGIGFTCVRLWKGTRADERRLKARKNAARLCPVCKLARVFA